MALISGTKLAPYEIQSTIFTGWIYDHLLPYAHQVKVAHPLMLRAIAATKKKNYQIDACPGQFPAAGPFAGR